ncbi:hypothetical protein [Desulfatiferula olefinivorans]
MDDVIETEPFDKRRDFPDSSKPVGLPAPDGRPEDFDFFEKSY